MKKFLSIVLVLSMVLALTACGKKGNNAADSTNNSGNTVTEAPAATETPATPTPTEAPAPALEEKTALEIFNKVWETYSEDEMFAGEIMDLGTGDAASVDSFVGLPEGSLAQVDEVSMLIHMMNANTFTCGGFHVTDAANVDAVVAALKDNVANRMWCCGFPDKHIIITIDQFVFSAFGNTEIMDVFVSKLTALYPTAVIAVDVPIE